jgi:gluconolactonase
MHMEILFSTVLAFVLVSQAVVFGGDDQIMAPGAKAEKLAGDFKFTEGPASDAEGNVFFTDQPNNRILKWSIDGKLSTFLEPSGRSNGMCFDNKGNLWTCADEKNELWRIDPAGKITVTVNNYQGKTLNGPNDVWIRADGGAYITDPLYKRPYWTDASVERAPEAVYYLSPDGQKLLRVADDLKKPNGIIGTTKHSTSPISAAIKPMPTTFSPMARLRIKNFSAN